MRGSDIKIDKGWPERIDATMGHVLDALYRLETLAEAGASADEVAHDAAVIAAGWW